MLEELHCEKTGLHGGENAPTWDEVFREDLQQMGDDQEKKVMAIFRGFVAAALLGVNMHMVRDL